MDSKKLQIVGEGIVGALTIAVMVVLSPFLRSWYSRWGTTEEEATREYPGDQLIPRPRSEITNAIAIDAPAEKIWPWFVQLGCQRGGWYSYDLLDNGGIPSADKIMPQCQELHVGDLVAAVPDGSFGFPVAVLEPERVLTLAFTVNLKTGKLADPEGAPPESFVGGEQTFFIERLSGHASRLVFHWRTDWTPTHINDLIYRGIVEPLSFVMARKMLRNVKRRAEMLAA